MSRTIFYGLKLYVVFLKEENSSDIFLKILPSQRNNLLKVKINFLFESLLQQFLLNSDNPSIFASSAFLGNSWYFDFVCCNHMTANSFNFSFATYVSTLPHIQIANSSFMHINKVGDVTLPNLSLDNTFFIPSLTLNLLSIG